MDFNDQAKYIRAYVKYGTWLKEVISDLFGDIRLVAFAMVTICIYLSIFLGSCSPLHCRMTLAILGIVVVVAACAAGFGIAFERGWLATEITQILPPLMIGIGVDDMFVICNSID